MAVVSFTTPNSPLLDPRTGSLTREWIKWFQNVAETVNTGFDPNGNYQGPIGANATIVGRHTLATIVQHLSDAGVIQAAGIDFSVTSPNFTQITGTAAPAQLPTATSAAQGAVKLPVGAPGSTLGSAAFNNTGDFDAAGSAATAQANAEAFASDAANLTSGNLDIARMPTSGFSGTITTAKLTGLGANGSMTFMNGILTAQTPAT